MNAILEFLRLSERTGLPPMILLTDKGRRASDVRAEWYVAMVEAGMSMSAIGRVCGRGRSTISRMVARYRAGATDQRKNNGRTA